MPTLRSPAYVEDLTSARLIRDETSHTSAAIKELLIDSGGGGGFIPDPEDPDYLIQA